MFSVILPDLLWFIAALGGLALPAWRWLGWTRGPERLALALAAGLVAGYLALFGLYVLGLPLRWFWALPAVGILHALLRPVALTELWRDPAVRGLLGRWLLLAAWCLGWHSLIVSYSGAGWAGDWTEHYQRVHFFLARWPTDFLFLEAYPLPARPPLVNLWLAGLMSQSGGGFAHFQVFTTLLSTLVLLPLAVLVARWRDNRRAQALLLGLLMLNPLLVQNATFPWTKLSAAFFVLLAITQLAPGGRLTRAALVSGAALLGAGLLAHYSAGPWICALGLAGAWHQRHEWHARHFQLSVLLAGLVALGLCATWFGWSLATYGPVTTFTANTAVSMAPPGSAVERIGRAASNLWFTLSPIPGDTDVPLLRQTSRLGQWRDHWFLLYQVKLPYAFGSAGCAVLLWLMLRLKWSRESGYWVIAATVALVLGTATHAQPDRLGLVHISLQPLVLLGLAWLATQSDRLPRWLSRIWTAALVLDLTLGIGLHFGLQSLLLDRWLRPGLTTAEYLSAQTVGARVNWRNKSILNATYLGDLVPPAASLVVLLAVGLTAGALYWRANRARES